MQSLLRCLSVSLCAFLYFVFFSTKMCSCFTRVERMLIACSNSLFIFIPSFFLSLKSIHRLYFLPSSHISISRMAHNFFLLILTQKKTHQKITSIDFAEEKKQQPRKNPLKRSKLKNTHI